MVITSVLATVLVCRSSMIHGYMSFFKVYRPDESVLHESLSQLSRTVGSLRLYSLGRVLVG